MAAAGQQSGGVEEVLVATVRRSMLLMLSHRRGVGMVWCGMVSVWCVVEQHGEVRCGEVWGFIGGGSATSPMHGEIVHTRPSPSVI